MRRATVVVAVCAVALGAASVWTLVQRDDPSGAEVAGVTTIAPARDDSTVAEGATCDAVRRIAELDEQTSRITSAALAQVHDAGDDPEARAAADAAFVGSIRNLDALVPALLGAYDDLAESAPADRRDDVEAVRGVTVSVMDAMSGVGSVEEFSAITESLDPASVSAAASATLRLDEWTKAECDLGFAR